ncbi:flavin reductase family protein [Rhizobiaceae bacterium BDR2-2]|uniref:Flavin reductase family protein n=1 Tax=Ectorhizobium quercum TaxID=2965071 RepID=A0AAE3MWU7_9HYPH|nr:flavin reductase family protein [Ectorhizobium quercum]MCX8996753.1 flavin reductase family protein [Ectorhizobium quercum]
MTATVTYLREPAIATTTRPEDLRLSMRHLAGGVCVITAGGGNDRTGATVTSATALSVDPPTMIVNINRSSSLWPVISRHNHFCVNVLAAGQRPVADNFAGKGGLKGSERYRDGEWYALESGALALNGALAAIDCAVEDVIERHTHAIVIGRVLAIDTGAGGEPLIYHDGSYGSFDGR